MCGTSALMVGQHRIWVRARPGHDGTGIVEIATQTLTRRDPSEHELADLARALWGT